MFYQIWVNALPTVETRHPCSDLGQRVHWNVRSGSTRRQQSKPAKKDQIWVNAPTILSDLGQRPAHWGTDSKKRATGEDAAALAAAPGVPVCGKCPRVWRIPGVAHPLCADHSPFDATTYNAPSRCCCYRGWCCRAAAARAARAASSTLVPGARRRPASNLQSTLIWLSLVPHWLIFRRGAVPLPRNVLVSDRREREAGRQEPDPRPDASNSATHPTPA